MSFCSAMGASGLTYTENGALTHSSSGSAIIDFFFHGAALRNERDTNCIFNLFENAFKENPEDALRILFYIRDIRGGQGERRVFKTILQEMIKNREIDYWLSRNIHLIPEYGRYDDMFCLVDTDSVSELSMYEFIANTLISDKLTLHTSKPCTLLAKWMPSENASSRETTKLARKFIKALHMTPKTYRHLLSNLRKKIKIVETKITMRDYKSIDYSTVPSKANIKYTNAFLRNDSIRYNNYIHSVQEGKAKINSNTLYPYEIYDKVRNCTSKELETYEALWKALPDYVDNLSGIVVADTSGSMYGRPMSVSVSLAMYIAERNKNEAFKDYFISFSEKPRFHKITGNTISERMGSVELGDCENTNIQAVFDLILSRSKMYRVPKEEMPKTIIIISDMEFDYACNEYNDSITNTTTNYEEIRRKYAEAGYDQPTLVFWNVNSRQSQTPITINDDGVLLCSGCSPVIMKYALSGTYNPMDLVKNVTESPRYSLIKY